MPPNPNGEVVAVEFYNRTLDHYFMSTNPGRDQRSRLRACTVGWERTGLRFLVYDDPAPGTSPGVPLLPRCRRTATRISIPASPAECAATAAAHPVDWIYESPNVFYVRLPDTTSGACPTGTQPGVPLLQRATTNHRYTTEIVIRNEMASSAIWTAEGYGPGPYYPIMCAVTQ